ncbi:hypothetical protein CLAFUW4_10990 [Fulvia fulva]|uniref:F-box domain-containing protein n=1 Tax=Passalora fulva TaxID=5499 RepID=A0A9Q8PD99_PASFU|nr:uncharacterized protein CLAFUR5_10033 [Fulvia fulva]KAK4619548.1 hypothetical protein CLAFUR4_10995 [Fulvia fulva]KAK4621148.1 hypothetical protein CLAFUR0_11002 [Fulvia fulva]UJO20297.1 hypothetical protein CLAFUR5_10033 [Fulvia fulva]WPV17079.1 hypothetical protein CLAFUW4_10990 [Fulvia fulva]WPV31823.1 hypothetical protein CLAFUW7_10988 [Fulvia fulva]
MPGGPPPATDIHSKDATSTCQLQSVFEEIAEASSAERHPSSEESLSILLSLPAELRTAIYEPAILASDSDLVILKTCRQVYMEASPMLWQRPVCFASQVKLFTWIQRSAETDIRRVRTLSLRLMDVDLSSLIDMSPRRGQRPSAWGLYQQELESLNDALQRLPALVDLTIIPCDRTGSQLLSGMYYSFLGMIPVHLPRLKQLTIHDCESVLEKVPSLRQLSKVIFDDSRRGSSSPSSTSPTSRGKRRVYLIKHEDSTPIKMELCEEDRL